MASNNNRDNNINNSQEQGWEESAFGWEDMKTGIFEKMLEEEPDFFEEKPKRRMALWFWLGIGLFAVSSLGYFLIHHSGNVETTPPSNTPAIEKTKKAPAIAAAPNSGENPIESPSISNKKNNRNQTPTTTQPYNQIANQTKFIQNVNAQNTTPLTEVTPVENIRIIADAQFLDVTIKPIIYEQQPPQLTLSFSPVATAKTAKPDRSMKLNLMGGANASFSKFAGSSEAAALRNENTALSFGYSYGADVWLPTGKNGYFTLGAERQVAYQLIDIYTERQVTTLVENALLEVTHYVVGSRTENTYGDTVVTATEKNRLVNYNEFLATQLNLGYAKSYEKGNWQISPFAGISTSLLQTKGKTVAADKSILEYGVDNPIYNRFQLKANLGIAAEFQLADQLALSLRYRLEKQLNNMSQEQDLAYRPVTQNLSVGVTKYW